MGNDRQQKTSSQTRTADFVITVHNQHLKALGHQPNSILSHISISNLFFSSKTSWFESLTCWPSCFCFFSVFTFHKMYYKADRLQAQTCKIHIKRHANLPVKNNPWQKETNSDILHAQTKHNVNDDFVQRGWRRSFWSATLWFEAQHSLPSSSIYSCFSHWGIRILTPNTAPVRTAVIFSGVVSLLTQTVTIHWRGARIQNNISLFSYMIKNTSPKLVIRSKDCLKFIQAGILDTNTCCLNE